MLGERLGREGWLSRAQQRPPPDRQRPARGAAPAERAQAALGTRLLDRREQAAEAGKAVPGHDAACDQLPQRVLRGAGEETRRRRDVGEEGGALRGEELRHVARRGRELDAREATLGRERRPVGGALAGCEQRRELLAQRERER